MKLIATLTFLMLTGILQAQNPKAQIDSLLKILPAQIEDSNRANTLNLISRNYWAVGDFPKSKIYSNEALTLSNKIHFIKGIGYAEHNLGKVCTYENKLEDGHNYFTESLKLMQQIGNVQGISRAYYGLAENYEYQENYPEALKYFYIILKIDGDKQVVAAAQCSAADLNSLLGNDSSAIQDYYASAKLFGEIGDTLDMAQMCYDQIAQIQFQHGHYNEALKLAMITSNLYDKMGGSLLGPRLQAVFSKSKIILGDIYLEQGKLALKSGDQPASQIKFHDAIKSYQEAENVFNETGDESNIVSAYLGLGNTYLQLREYSKARDYLEKSLHYSKKQNDKTGLQYNYECLSILDSISGKFSQAFTDYKLSVRYRDSSLTLETTKKLVQAQMNYAFEKKETIARSEQDKKDFQQLTIRNSIAGGFAGAIIFLIVVYRQRNKISTEKKRSDELLLNILPAETAEELKNTGSTKAKDFSEVTVLFTDFKNFTSLSEKLSAQELVNEINYCYSTFDNIITKFGIEKIKTIGDSYMCAGGLPVANKTNAVDTLNAALEIRDFMLQEKQKRDAENKPFFEIRIGCNTGPVIAGIVGIKKFSYDIWGDTVNIASRMESSGEPGKVNISNSTYELVKDQFKCTHRGKIEAKNKGMIDMYFAEKLI